MIIVDQKRKVDESTRLKDVHSYVRSFIELSKLSRTSLEKSWLFYWALYLNTTEAQEQVRNSAIEIIGNVSTEWRHKLSIGKGYEVVETIHGYLMSSTFPNADWFIVEPYEPVDRRMARILTKYTRMKLEKGNFRSQYDMFLRQLIITGISTLFMPWNDEEECVEFEVLDNFDVFHDYTSSKGFDKGNVAIQKQLSRAEFLQRVRDGDFPHLKIDDVMYITSSDDVILRSEKNRIKQFNGVTLTSEVSLQDIIVYYEYWGDVHLENEVHKNMHVGIVGDKLMFFEQSVYAERPFVTVSYTPVVRMPSGIGIIQPIAGVLATLDITNNQRLDNAEISINNMWTLLDTSTLSPEEVFSEPGHVFRVTTHQDLQPVQVDGSRQVQGLTEVGVLENMAEKTSGTGSFISSGQGRKGERVTAEEIIAVQEAGGNRLSNSFKHIEDTGMIPILTRVMMYQKDFVLEDSVVPLEGYEANTTDFWDVGPKELRGFAYRFRPRGADYVIGQQQWVRRRTEFLALVSASPELSSMVNMEALFMDILEGWGFEDPMKYIASKEPGTEASPIQQVGGVPLENAVNAEVAIDGGTEAIQKMTGKPLEVNFNDILQKLGNPQ